MKKLADMACRSSSTGWPPTRPGPKSLSWGEPTEMQIITGHKGGYEMRTEVTGHAVHSSDPGQGVNAISYANAADRKN